MEQSLTFIPARRPWLRIALARLLQAIGWAGLAGLGFTVAATVVAVQADERRDERSRTRTLVAASDAVEAPAASIETAPQPAAVRLARRDEIPLVLTRIERAVTGGGLPWSAADYRVVPATDRQPAVLEVRCSFKAPYPKLRSMLAELVGTLPAMTFREMSFTRASVESQGVEAKFVIAVFLAEAPSLTPASAR